MKPTLITLPGIGGRTVVGIGAGLVWLAFAALGSDPGEWASWRGPGFRGSSDNHLPTRWKADEALWKVPLPGKGSSTPILWRGRVILTAPAEGQDTVLAFDPSGQLLWQTAVGPASAPKHRTLGSSSNGSPVTDGDAVFAYFRSGSFAALESDGSLRWKVDLTEEFGSERLFWDTGTSPVVTRQHVVLARRHDGESWIAGFDRQTGELRWRQSRNFTTPVENNNAYNTPLVYHEGDREALLVWGADHLTAHDAADGTLLWSCGGFNPRQTGYWPAIASPILLGDIVIVPVGRDDRPGQSSIYGVRVGGRGDVTDSHRVWKREDVGVFVTTPSAYEGKVYLLRHRGEVVCLEPTTGQTIWTGEFPRGQSSYYASPLVAGGILYAAREDGKVFTAHVGERFELLAEHDLEDRVLASPVPFGSRLLLRTDGHLFCIGQD